MLNDAVKGFLYRILRTPSREALYDRATQRRYTYADLGCRGARLATWLTREQHLGVGDVVALTAENGVPFIDAFYASLMTGVVITTYNGRLLPEDIAPLIAREKPAVQFVSEAYRAKIAEAAEIAGVESAFVSIDGGEDCPVPTYGSVMQTSVNPRAVTSFEGFGDFDAEETCLLVHTGGTTGLPKSAKISYRAVLYNALSEILTVGFTQHDVGITYLPFFHTVGWNITTIPLLLCGGRVVLTDTLDPGVLLHLINTEHPTTGLALEAVFLRMAAHPDFAHTDFSSYRLVANGAGPISDTTLQLYWSRGVRLVNAYGMTETGPNNCFFPDMDATLDEVKRHSDSVGKPMCFNELKIVDEAGDEVEIGRDGELLWRGPVTFSGYWGNPEATAAVMVEGGWVRSGDIGHIDPYGYVHLRGRRKNMIITNGENVFPIEIENVLKAHPDVADCYVIAAPDSVKGEVGKALVMMREGAAFDREALRAWAKDRLSSIKVPAYYTQVQSFPQRGLKVNLTELKERYGFAGD